MPLGFYEWLSDSGVSQAEYDAMDESMQNEYRIEYNDYVSSFEVGEEEGIETLDKIYEKVAPDGNTYWFNEFTGMYYSSIEDAQNREYGMDIGPLKVGESRKPKVRPLGEGDEPPTEPPAPPIEPPTEPGEEDFSQQLAAAVAAYQQQIGEWGASQRAEAQRLSARNIGKMSRMQQMAMLAQGRTAGEIEQLSAGGMEAGARSMADLIKQINLQTQQQQAGAAQFGIGTMISGEEMAQRQREMAMAGGQFQQNLAEQIRQFNLAQQQQAGQFGQMYGPGGYYQDVLGTQQQMAKYGMYGDIAQGVGSFFGSFF